MPLEPVEEAAAFTDPSTNAVSLVMRDIVADRQVKVAVEPAALQKFPSGSNPVQIVQDNRAAIAQAASAKFDRVGGGTELTIGPDDLAGRH